MTPLVLDTHAFVWFLQKDKRLPLLARHAICSSKNMKYVPMIVLCEIHYLNAHGRFPIGLSDVLNILKDTIDFQIISHGEEQLLHLKNDLGIHDALIVASALFLQEREQKKICIVTKDEEIQKMENVHILWK